MNESPNLRDHGREILEPMVASLLGVVLAERGEKLEGHSDTTLTDGSRASHAAGAAAEPAGNWRCLFCGAQ